MRCQGVTRDKVRSNGVYLVVIEAIKLGNESLRVLSSSNGVNFLIREGITQFLERALAISVQAQQQFLKRLKAVAATFIFCQHIILSELFRDTIQVFRSVLCL